MKEDDDWDYCYKTCVNTPCGCTRCERMSEPYGFDEEKGEEIYKDLYERRMYVHRHGECLTIEEDDSEHSVFSGSQKECEDYIENM